MVILVAARRAAASGPRAEAGTRTTMAQGLENRSEQTVDTAMQTLRRLEVENHEEKAERVGISVSSRRLAPGDGGVRLGWLAAGASLAVALALTANLHRLAPMPSSAPAPGSLRDGPEARHGADESVSAVAEPETEAMTAAPSRSEPDPASGDAGTERRVPAGPPQVVWRSPADSAVTVTAGGQEYFEIAVRSDTDDRTASFTWIVDGQVLGTGPDAARIVPMETPGERRVRVIARNAAGAAEPVEWRVTVRSRSPQPPAILRQIPAAGTPVRVAEDRAVDLRVVARDPDGDAGLRYRWLVDGREVGQQSTFRFRAEYPVGSRKTVEARIRDADGLEAAPARWEVEVTPRLREPEALAWVERFQSAWLRRDLETFRLYGLVRTDAEAEALRAQLARQRRYRVQFSPGRARVSGPYGSVSFVRQELDGSRIVSSVVETYQIEKHRSGLVTLRGVPPP